MLSTSCVVKFLVVKYPCCQVSCCQVSGCQVSVLSIYCCQVSVVKFPDTLTDSSGQLQTSPSGKETLGVRSGTELGNSLGLIYDRTEI